MTKLNGRKRPIVLETDCIVRGRPLVAEITLNGVELREKGCRTTYLVPWMVQYWCGAKLAAESRRKGRGQGSGIRDRER